MYAVIESGGKQYKVESGDVLFLEKLDVEADANIVFDKVVALHDGNELKVGSPYVDGASVDGRVIKNGRGKKIRVFTYRPKKGSKRAMGHRQPYTQVQISMGETDAKVEAKVDTKAKADVVDSKATADVKVDTETKKATKKVVAKSSDDKKTDDKK